MQLYPSPILVMIMFGFLPENCEEVWEENSSNVEFEDVHEESNAPTLPHFENISTDSRRSSVLSRWLIGFLLILQMKFSLPDRALDLLVKFLHAFFSVVGNFAAFVGLLANVFPASVYTMCRCVQYCDTFSKFVVCPKCCTTYPYKECITGGSRSICSFVRYPRHPLSHQRKPYGALLVRVVGLFNSGQSILYHFKVYCYKSLKESLQTLLMHPGFYSECQLWRNRSTGNFLEEVYDGQIWKEFQHSKGAPFLALPFAFAYILNIDWFQPFTHTVASIGVVYLTIINLPRYLHYKRENVILVGIIPGPHEPKLHKYFLEAIS